MKTNTLVFLALLSLFTGCGELQPDPSTPNVPVVDSTTLVYADSDSDADADPNGAEHLSPTHVESCDPIAQTGCEDHQKCVPYAQPGASSFNANMCVDVLGRLSAGEPCTRDALAHPTDDCDADSFCWDVERDVGGSGVCRAFCTGTDDDPLCAADTSCSISNSGAVALCIPTCDPVLQDCADERQGCHWMGDDFQCVDGVQGTQKLGDSCDSVDDCVAGTECVTSDALPDCKGASCCAAYCELDDSRCDSDTACMPFFAEGAGPAGSEHVGACIDPNYGGN
jgi:hypothetical protein